jgi:hypothetical protein
LTAEEKKLTTHLTVNYGLDSGYQVKASLPFEFSKQNVYRDGESSDYDNSSSQLSTIDLGLQKQLIDEGDGYPGVIVGLTAGFGRDSNISIGCNFSKTLDPAILFANLNYTKNFGSTNESSPDYLLASVGFGMKLNNDLMVDIALLGRYRFESGSGDKIIADQDDYRVNFALNWRVGKNVFFQPFIETNISGPNDGLTIGSSVVFTP